MNVVPFPTSLTKVISPLWASTRRLQTASPNPCPFDLVVTNGVKSFGLTSSGMPIPVSSTVMKQSPPFWKVLMINFPPLGMACKAFVARLVRTRFIIAESATIFVASSSTDTNVDVFRRRNQIKRVIYELLKVDFF